jgi:hypothetical protein
MDDPTPDHWRTRTTRRALVGGLAGLSAAAMLRRTVAGQTSTPDATVSSCGRPPIAPDAVWPINVAFFTAIDPFPSGLLDQVGSVLAKLVHDHFAPVWDIDATVTTLSSDLATIGPTDWQLEILDQRQAPVSANGVEGGGHHWWQPDTGKLQPRAWTYYKDPKSLAFIAGHELLEMLANPYLMQFHRARFPIEGDVEGLYFQEICDPCTTHNDFEIDDLIVPEFVTPAYYGRPNNAKTGSALSSSGSIVKPFEPMVGGSQPYLSLDLTERGEITRPTADEFLPNKSTEIDNVIPYKCSSLTGGQ